MDVVRNGTGRYENPSRMTLTQESFGSLTKETLVDPRERTYYRILLVFSLLVWAVVVVSIVGLLYGAIIGFFVWLGAESVEVTPTQVPELHATLMNVCGTLGLAEVPRLFIVQSGGLLNAFATRFLKRNFVAVFSSYLEACGPDSPEIRFVLGHEIGHLQRKHLTKHLLLLPGRLLPLIGNAYSRACEATCDRYGAFASGDLAGAIRALLILSGGQAFAPKFSAESFSRQYRSDRGFFVSWHELLSGYPTAAQRVSNLVAVRANQPVPRAERHPLAYLFALFTFSGPGGALSSILLTYLILALVFLPVLMKSGATHRTALTDPFSEATPAYTATPTPAPAERKVDARLVGTWRGSNAGNLHWVIERRGDGAMTIHVTSDAQPKPAEYHGHWFVAKGKYFEEYDEGDLRPFRLDEVTADRVKSYDEEDELSVEEVRVK